MKTINAFVFSLILLIGSYISNSTTPVLDDEPCDYCRTCCSKRSRSCLSSSRRRLFKHRIDPIFSRTWCVSCSKTFSADASQSSNYYCYRRRYSTVRLFTILVWKPARPVPWNVMHATAPGRDHTHWRLLQPLRRDLSYRVCTAWLWTLPYPSIFKQPTLTTLESF